MGREGAPCPGRTPVPAAGPGSAGCSLLHPACPSGKVPRLPGQQHGVRLRSGTVSSCHEAFEKFPNGRFA